ncbi:MAG: hypothetical protein H0W87_05505 [Actinobacteria bacterium]|nr:hypothetical protein [Actinomycetota bacterium]
MVALRGNVTRVAQPWRNVRPAAETEAMNLEESIAVAVGIAVALSFLAFFLFDGFGIGLS